MDNILQQYKVAESGCWEWTGYRTKSGYGTFSYKGKNIQAHRHFYTTYKADIPDGLHVDHLCFNPPCVNPRHLEAVTPGENSRRSWVKRAERRNNCCPHGHPLYGSNLYITIRVTTDDIWRTCRICKSKAQMKWKRKRSAIRKAAKKRRKERSQSWRS